MEYAAGSGACNAVPIGCRSSGHQGFKIRIGFRSHQQRRDQGSFIASYVNREIFAAMVNDDYVAVGANEVFGAPVETNRQRVEVGSKRKSLGVRSPMARHQKLDRSGEHLVNVHRAISE
jgi:hypothetical protein